MLDAPSRGFRRRAAAARRGELEKASGDGRAEVYRYMKACHTACAAVHAPGEPLPRSGEALALYPGKDRYSVGQIGRDDDQEAALISRAGLATRPASRRLR